MDVDGVIRETGFEGVERIVCCVLCESGSLDGVEQVEERRADEPADKEHGEDRRGGLWLIWVFVFLIVYVLSVGPVARLYSGKTPPRALMMFYAPLEFAYYHLPPAKEFIDWYLRVCGAK